MSSLWLSKPQHRVTVAALPLTAVAFGLVFAACGGGAATQPDAGRDATVAGSDAGGDATMARADAGDTAASSPDGGDALADAASVLQTRVTNYQYDPASRLKSATIGMDGMPPAASATPQYSYGYDPASNPTAITANGVTQSPTYTSTNAIIGGDYDPNGNPKTQNGATYTWDAANRLVSATVAGVETDFTYDGMSRPVRIVVKKGASVLSDKAYTWSGTTRVTEHDNLQSGSPVSKQYFAQGVIATNQGYYYARDRPGSVRQLVDSTGAIRAQYDYDPYGNQTKLNGDVDSDVGFSGLFHNASSRLDIARRRLYSPAGLRWLNRDPIGEVGGLNLYWYVGGNPVNEIDPSGLKTLQFGPSAILTSGGAAFPFGFGIAVDDHGNIGIYVYAGLAAGEGLSENVGLSVQSSNAVTVNDLSGPFNVASASAGDGPDVGIDVFSGNSANGPVIGQGVTFGAGEGASIVVGQTDTAISSVNIFDVASNIKSGLGSAYNFVACRL